MADLASPPPTLDEASRAETTAQDIPGPNRGEVAPWRSGLLLFLAFVVGLSYLFNPPISVQAEAGVIPELPVSVGDYVGKPGEITAVERGILPEDTEFARRFYTDVQGHQINCTIVLAGSEQRSIHRPEACLTGQGWTIVAQTNVPIDLQSGHRLIARNLSLERQVVNFDGSHITVRADYLYWFVGDNVTTPSHFTRILLSNWDRVVHNRAHRWAYVSVFSQVTDTPEQALALMCDFTKQVVPSFQKTEMPPEAHS